MVNRKSGWRISNSIELSVGNSMLLETLHSDFGAQHPHGFYKN